MQLITERLFLIPLQPETTSADTTRHEEREETP